MELSVWLIKRGILGGLSKDSLVYCGNMHRKIFLVIYGLQTIENYYQLWLHVLLYIRSFIAVFMHLRICLPYCAWIDSFRVQGAYIHSFAVIFHHLSVHMNIRSAHCPCTYSLAVYIYNSFLNAWEDIIIYAFCFLCT